MALQRITFNVEVRAPIEIVFEHFADHHWLMSLFGQSTRIVSEGQKSPHGVGSTRRMLFGPLSYDETTILHEPHSRINYKVTRGSVIKHHLGAIQFIQDGDITHINYSIQFEGKFRWIEPVVIFLIRFNWDRYASKRLAALATGYSPNCIEP